MKNIILLSLCMVGTLSSCAAKKEVQYVYVKPPQPTSLNVVVPRNDVVRAETPVPQNPLRLRTNKRVESPRIVDEFANDDTDGSVIRAGGRGSSTDFSMAKNEAMLDAKANLLSVVGEAIRKSVNQIKNDVSVATKNKLEKFESRLVGSIYRPRIVCFYSSEGEKTEYAVCLEVNEENLAVSIGPLLDAFTQRELAEIANAINENDEEIVDSASKLIGTVVAKKVKEKLSK